MASAREIEQDLMPVFTSEQARVLARVIGDARENPPKTGDFSELKSAVLDLAQAQKLTELQVRELAAAQQRTESRVEELAVAQQRTESRVEELAAAQHRTESRVDKLALAVEDLALAQKGTEKELRNLARQVGGLSEAFGGSLEDFAIDLVPELLEKNWGMEIDEAGRDELNVNGNPLDFDLVVRGRLDGRPLIVLGEVKSNVTPGEVQRFIQLARKAGQSSQEEVRILFFGYRASREARDLIKQEGAYMVFTHGKLL